VRAQPVRGRHAPAIARDQTGEPVLRHRGDEVVPDSALVLEELRAHHRADRVAAEVFRTGVAAAVAVEARDRIGAARFQLSAQHVPLGHARSIADAHRSP
jgi:hypothetical protein